MHINKFVMLNANNLRGRLGGFFCILALYDLKLHTLHIEK